MVQKPNSDLELYNTLKAATKFADSMDFHSKKSRPIEVDTLLWELEYVAMREMCHELCGAAVGYLQELADKSNED
ncbi:hypothetical protein LCGC14_2839370 [marine sediment metagenome]|uniref:Uncharacterized protein n=1 Tax=marine sediment metagenome TaxID=412755 RepID=A0A0F8YYE5_9ZZZZ